ncbi:MAG: 4Fe-4S ferredoxin [Methanobacterium sp. BRmetb2]|nr:MAG: 4Fe-4S ferredoxin [Methanobacterium sp. BRmetb2]
MESETLKNDAKDKCRELGIPLVGFAGVDRWENPPSELPNQFQEWIPRDFWPQSIYPEAKTVMVIGLPIQIPILDTAPSIYYHELYNTVNILLDIKAYEIANFLTEKGHPSIFLPRDGYGDINVLIDEPLAFFSHKHAAFLAGLGSFGLNNVILTKEYGPRVRFTSIFTSAPIKSDELKTHDLCIRCLKCADCCPVDAIPNSGDFPPLMDKITCTIRSQELREEYRSPCGICIKVCPVGMDREIFNREDTSIYFHRSGPDKITKSWKHIRKYGSKK